MGKIKHIDFQGLPVIGNGDKITLNKHTLALERVEAKLNEMIDRINKNEEPKPEPTPPHSISRSAVAKAAYALTERLWQNGIGHGREVKMAVHLPNGDYGYLRITVDDLMHFIEDKFAEQVDRNDYRRGYPVPRDFHLLSAEMQFKQEYPKARWEEEDV